MSDVSFGSILLVEKTCQGVRNDGLQGRDACGDVLRRFRRLVLVEVPGHGYLIANLGSLFSDVPANRVYLVVTHNHA